MYAHQVIEDLREQIKDAKRRNLNELVWRMEIAAEDIIPSCQKFHFDDGDAVFNINSRDTVFMCQSTAIKTPYDSMWIDYKMKDGKIGVAIIHYNETSRLYAPVDEYELFCFRWFSGTKKWAMAPNIKFIHNGIFSNYTDPVKLAPVTIDEFGDEFIEYCARLAHNAILLLNCKNIQTEKIRAPELLNKKRRRAGKQEIFNYYVLNLIVPSNKKRDYQDKSIPLSHNRVHLCRGHFKEYTTEHPLFGIHTGLYWWQPHVRGQNKDGIIMKDYNVVSRY